MKIADQPPPGRAKRRSPMWLLIMVNVAAIVSSLGLVFVAVGPAHAWQTNSAQPTAEPVPTSDEFVVGSANVVAGSEVTPVGKYPFVVALGTTSDAQLCAGSLIGPTWVLTAAHCFFDSNTDAQVVFAPDLLVGVGVHNIVTGPGEFLTVANIVVHPDFVNASFQNDIALVELATPATLGSPVTLARTDDSALSAAGAIGTVMGWGFTDAGLTSATLTEADVVFRADDACVRSWGFFPVDPSTQVCAVGSAGQDACRGDSGGPLIGPAGDGPWTLLGIVSFGAFCGAQEPPAVYTEVAGFTSWIRDVSGLSAASFPGPSGTPVCIESAVVQSDPAASALGAGDRFTGVDGVPYLITTGALTCSFHCADGYDANCDGVLGDFCPVELDLRLVADVAACLSIGQPQDSLVNPSVPAAVAEAIPVSGATALALTGADTAVASVGLTLVGSGAFALAISARRRRLQATT